MLREQKLEIFEDLYIEATRYAKEIHKKRLPVDYDKMSPLEQVNHKYEKINNDSIRVGKNRYGRDLSEQKALGVFAKCSHPGYQEDDPFSHEKKPGLILDKQIKKDSKKGKEPSKKQIEEIKRVNKKYREISDKRRAYYKNTNHGKSEYNQKTDKNKFSKI